MHMYTHIYKYTHARTCLGKGNVNRLPSDEHVLHNVLMSFGLDDVPILFPLITSFMSFQHQPLSCRGFILWILCVSMKSHEDPRYLFKQVVLGTSVCVGGEVNF